MDKRRCIFHIPNHIDISIKSGSQLRPYEMINGFKENGYIVDCVMGYGNERKKQIKQIKENIKNGIKYDFLYSESSTMPTLLTEKNHFPQYPLLDFSFMKFCKKNKIKIGLFYRDIQWKYEAYKREVTLSKRMITYPLYRYDLYNYKKYVDIFYLPTEQVKTYLSDYPELIEKSDVLMPGSKTSQFKSSCRSIEEIQKELRLFYVGGIYGIYDLKIFLRVTSKMKHVKAIVCCRKEEWKRVENIYGEYINENIKIIHASGNELEKYYLWADVCSVYAGEGTYFSVAMPIKTFEYLGHLKPMIGVKGTCSGDYIEEKNLGWNVSYNEKALEECLSRLLKNPEEIINKRVVLEKQLIENTWAKRCQKVIHDLVEER